VLVEPPKGFLEIGLAGSEGGGDVLGQEKTVSGFQGSKIGRDKFKFPKS